MFEADISKNSAYNNLTPEQITFIKRGFWSAFFNPLNWAVGNRLYLLALESLIPFWGIIIWLRLIFRGGMLSWEQGGWKNFEEFKGRQKNLAWITLGIIIVSGIVDWLQLVIVAVLAVMAYNGFSKSRKKPLTPPDAPLTPPMAPLETPHP